jgi:arylsulfatase
VSLRPTFAGNALARSQPIFWEHEGNRAVRDGKWKLVSKYPDGWKLYDIEADRTELHDLAGAQPEQAKQMAAQWEAWAQRVGVQPWAVLQKAAPKEAIANSHQTIAHR